jgi:hypothetical protein
MIVGVVCHAAEATHVYTLQKSTSFSRVCLFISMLELIVHARQAIVYFNFDWLRAPLVSMRCLVCVHDIHDSVFTMCWLYNLIWPPLTGYLYATIVFWTQVHYCI